MTDGDFLRKLRERATHPPCSTEAVAMAEEQLGFPLPPFLRYVYQNVADGGFGPGGGLFSVQRGHRSHREGCAGEGLVQVYEEVAVEPDWPRHLLPICDWGRATWSCLDCRSPEGQIVTSAGDAPLAVTGRDVRGWLLAWLDGVDLWAEMFEPMTSTGQGRPRGAPWA
ncbi:SMI1/KNR4 family protein [Pendulispora brunnea]|uniref:SMI1/KNR4 family protein n=1 Tax=Pendulispora brunnea TaxID=2905690 RepID=A0ABZ2KGV3_9BACT